MGGRPLVLVHSTHLKVRMKAFSKKKKAFSKVWKPQGPRPELCLRGSGSPFSRMSCPGWKYPSQNVSMVLSPPEPRLAPWATSQALTGTDALYFYRRLFPHESPFHFLILCPLEKQILVLLGFNPDSTLPHPGVLSKALSHPEL